MMLEGTQINYMHNKSHVIIIIINTQGKIFVSPSFDKVFDLETKFHLLKKVTL